MKEKITYFLSALASAWINLFGDKTRNFKNILLIKKDEIGDMVTALHVFDLLHQRYPKAKMDLICKPFNRIFFTYLPYVNCLEEEHQKDSYELIVDLRGDFQSVIRALYKGTKYRLDRGTIRFENKYKGGQVQEWLCNYQIIEPLLKGAENISNHVTISKTERDTIQYFLKQNQITNYAIMHIGARDKARRWPPERFASVIDSLYNERKINTLLVGGSDDHSLNENCIALCKSPVLNTAGAFDLLELTALCEGAKFFLGNESGPLHIAATTNIPIVALFGPGVKDVFYPVGNKVKIHHYFLEKDHTKQTEANSTLLRISVDEVCRSINELL